MTSTGPLRASSNNAKTRCAISARELALATQRCGGSSQRLIAKPRAVVCGFQMPGAKPCQASSFVWSAKGSLRNGCADES
jgi:hypothetical protein